MKTSLKLILLICALSVQQCQSNPLLALKIAKHSWDVLKFATNFIESSNKIDKISNQIENINKEFKNYINDVRESKLSLFLYYKILFLNVSALDQIEQALQNINTQIRKELRWHEIREHITDINNAYEDLIKYKSNVKFEAFTITDFAKNAISFQPTSIKSRLNFLHSYLIDKKGTVFMSNIKDLWKAQEVTIVCKIKYFEFFFCYFRVGNMYIKTGSQNNHFIMMLSQSWHLLRQKQS